MPSTFKLYCDGSVQFRDESVTRPVTFAHVTDLHLPGIPCKDWPQQYRRAIAWWNEDMANPDRIVGKLLDQIGDAGVDFVFFGGDTLDYYNATAAKLLCDLCQQRGLAARFQLGNHDCESEYLRFVSHEFDAEVIAQNRARLCEHWQMPNSDYVFDVGGVRFLSLSVDYKHVGQSLKGVITDTQADWLIEQLHQDGVLLIFHHIPFALPTTSPRLAQYWSGKLACIIEDGNGQRVREAIEQSPSVLGTFTGHAHMRSEDPFGRTWQFMTGPAHLGDWRYVKISNEQPPKSINIAGEPTVTEG